MSLIFIVPKIRPQQHKILKNRDNAKLTERRNEFVTAYRLNAAFRNGARDVVNSNLRMAMDSLDA